MQQGKCSALTVAALVFTMVGSAQASPIRKAHTTVVGGQVVQAGDPVAQLTVGVRGAGLCSGTVIDQDLIITAAHCLEGLEYADDVTVVFGLTFDGADTIRIGANSFLIHEEYNAEVGANRNDVALIRLDAPLPAGYRPAPILAAEDVVAAGETVTVAGFGIDSAGWGGGGAGTLRKTDILMEDYNYSPIEVRLDSSHGSSDCNGDSGGPAFVQRDGQLVLIGADNWGPSSCDSFSVYAKVPAQQVWLQEAAVMLRAPDSIPGLRRLASFSAVR